MWEIRHAGAKGLGVFASRPIARGTRILAEEPWLEVKDARGVFAAVRRLNGRDKEAFLRLSISPVRRSSFRAWAHAATHVARQGLHDLIRVARENGRGLPQLLPNAISTILEYPAILSVFRNNNFDLGNRQAVFRHISRLNHACKPSAQGNFNTALGRFTIHALRPIEPGEEITISYLSEHGALKECRQQRLLSSYGFLCDCPACDTTTPRGRQSEARRLQLQASLHAWQEGITDGGLSGHVAELHIVESMLQMYQVEGIFGREVATTYLAAAELAAKAGMMDDVAEYVEKGLRMEKDCCGTDSPTFQASLERARGITTGLGASGARPVSNPEEPASHQVNYEPWM
ncbi:SET domain-containing protein 5-like [Teratosphaeria destructans]|uniref:SET domain-containing protein 5-like n=1 Tax=Teratosphaeria destructans TaxID=418781 RepID=A0A9W7SPG7_9PEZI|nr:SET domain-containing protein 5-like [Teratosphaeria destructans]